VGQIFICLGLIYKLVFFCTFGLCILGHVEELLAEWTQFLVYNSRFVLKHLM
jgi:hypothetical protein